MRYPQLKNTATPENINGMNNVLNELRMDSNRLVLTMLEDPIYFEYDTFASAGVPVGRLPPKTDQSARAKVIRASGNLEALHGLYHGAIGGIGQPLLPGGHMTRISVAAFDPVFVSLNVITDPLPVKLANPFSGCIMGKQQVRALGVATYLRS